MPEQYNRLSYPFRTDNLAYLGQIILPMPVTYQVSLLKYKEYLVFYIKSDVFYIIFDVFRRVKIFYFTPFCGDITTSPAVCFALYRLPMRSFSPSASVRVNSCAGCATIVLHFFTIQRVYRGDPLNC